MKVEALDWWERAKVSLNSARALVDTDPDGSASRAYYAAFFAVSALFATEGKTFSKHTAVEAAVHRDLVRTGRWSTELGAAFSALAALRLTGDYGGRRHVSQDDAKEAIRKAEAIVDVVHGAAPAEFAL
jgi:uncharacterized protein (UPF0332 family)